MIAVPVAISTARPAERHLDDDAAPVAGETVSLSHRETFDVLSDAAGQPTVQSTSAAQSTSTGQPTSDAVGTDGFEEHHPDDLEYLHFGLHLQIGRPLEHRRWRLWAGSFGTALFVHGTLVVVGLGLAGHWFGRYLPADLAFAYGDAQADVGAATRAGAEDRLPGAPLPAGEESSTGATAATGASPPERAIPPTDATNADRSAESAVPAAGLDLPRWADTKAVDRPIARQDIAPPTVPTEVSDPAGDFARTPVVESAAVELPNVEPVSEVAGDWLNPPSATAVLPSFDARPPETIHREQRETDGPTSSPPDRVDASEAAAPESEGASASKEVVAADHPASSGDVVASDRPVATDTADADHPHSSGIETAAADSGTSADGETSRGSAAAAATGQPPVVSASGEGGATTGDRGTAATGLPGVPAGLRDGVARPAPVYPELSRRLGEEGVVVLNVEILADGAVGKVDVVDDNGHPRLAEAARASLVGYRFRPATRGGEPVRAVQSMPFNFSLRRR